MAIGKFPKKKTFFVSLIITFGWYFRDNIVDWFVISTKWDNLALLKIVSGPRLRLLLFCTQKFVKTESQRVRLTDAYHYSKRWISHSKKKEYPQHNFWRERSNLIEILDMFACWACISLQRRSFILSASTFQKGNYSLKNEHETKQKLMSSLSSFLCVFELITHNLN